VNNDNKQLIEEVKNGDLNARDKLIENNLGLIWSMVNRFKSREYESEDLFQVGCIGLIKAIDNFDLEYNVKFSTYAVPMILGEIRRFLRDDNIIKVGRRLKNLSVEINNAKHELQREMGREPTISEIAEKINTDPAEIAFAFEATQRVHSLDEPLFTDDNDTNLLLLDTVSDKDYEEKLIDKIALKETLRKLEPRERQIIFLRYFKDKTQTEIAKLVGISQVQVSRIEKKVIEKLKSDFY